MLRNIIAVVGGFIGSMALLSAMRNLGACLNPLPDSIDPSDFNQMMEFHATQSTNAFLFESASFGLACFFGSFITARIAGSQKFNLGVLTGVVFFVATLVLLFSIPNPIWVIVLDIVLLVFCIYLGSRLAAGGVPDYDL